MLGWEPAYMLAGHFGIYHLTSFQLLQGISPPLSLMETQISQQAISQGRSFGGAGRGELMHHLDYVLA